MRSLQVGDLTCLPEGVGRGRCESTAGELAVGDPVWPVCGIAEASAPVLLVVAPRSFEPFHPAVAFEGEDVGGDAVEEPAVVGDDQDTAGEAQDRFLEGTEVTCGVLGGGGEAAEALPLTEIVPVADTFFDFRAKYTAAACREITPARVDWSVSVGDRVSSDASWSSAVPSALASPKSSTLTCPSGVSWTLAGLRSRWITPLT